MSFINSVCSLKHPAPQDSVRPQRSDHQLETLTHIQSQSCPIHRSRVFRKRDDHASVVWATTTRFLGMTLQILMTVYLQLFFLFVLSLVPWISVISNRGSIISTRPHSVCVLLQEVFRCCKSLQKNAFSHHQLPNYASISTAFPHQTLNMCQISLRKSDNVL